MAGQFDLINGGMARNTLFVSSAYFRNPKALDNVAWIKAPQSRRGLLGEKNTQPGRILRQETESRKWVKYI